MHVFHSWGKWELYEERGDAILGRFSGSPGSQATYIMTRQSRNCKVCGKTEDEKVKDGPLPFRGGTGEKA